MWNSYLPLEAGSYLDSSIPELYGQELTDEFQQLHGEWTRLKNGIRMFLGEKSIHADTRVHYTTKRLLGCESGVLDYQGNITSSVFDPGPATWCIAVLDNATTMVHERIQLQRIEKYTVRGYKMSCKGLIVGTLGLVISMISLAISLTPRCIWNRGSVSATARRADASSVPHLRDSDGI